MMEVLYDGHIYDVQAAGGINRYYENILARLPADVEPTLLVTRRQGVNFPQASRLQTVQPPFLLPGRVGRLIRKMYFRQMLARRPFDLAHPTYYTLLTGQALRAYKCPVVLTVWDMVHEVRAPEMDLHGHVARVKRDALLSADAILCISHNTKKDLLERFPQLEDRVTVTHLATGITEALCPEEGVAVPERPFYLYVGSRIGYKNVAFLLHALARVVEKRPAYLLCLVGGPLTDVEQNIIRDLHLEGHVQLLGHVDDVQLACLYRASLALVYPSLYEGFGIPPLEAMSCGTPVVACNTSSLPEVVGDAALLFEPDAIDDLVGMMLSVTDESLRRTLVARGRERAKLFSWERTVAQTVEVYRILTAAGRRNA